MLATTTGAQAAPSHALKPIGPKFFNTIPPGKKLPSGAQCAKWVRSRPIKENKGVNRKFNQNIVFAQAAVESWWRQTTKGDWETNGCPPGHGPGVDGKAGQCPQSWGILQNRYPFERSSWPGIMKSTAMNADLAYGIWRTCFDGYETWLNTVGHGYKAGDAWGCVGRWFAGRWHTQPAQQYIAFVRKYLKEKIWTTPDFQQP